MRDYIIGGESTILDALTIMSKPEEVLGMIQGVADALKSSHDNQKATQHQIEALAKTVHELAAAEKPAKSIAHDGQALHLPPVTLPVFKGDPQERLERFLDYFVSIIYTSNISPHYYVQYLKQLCQSDLRSFDIITNAETEHFAKLIKDPAKASPDDYKAYFEVVKQTFLQKRGTPKGQQIRELFRNIIVCNRVTMKRFVILPIVSLTFRQNFRNSYQGYI